MAVKSFDEVMKDLRKEAIEVPEEIPPERGEYREPLVPGAYRFRCPAALGFEDVEFTKKDAEGRMLDEQGNVTTDPAKAAKFQRLNLVFDEAHPLTITQAPDPKVIGEPFYTRISNLERNRFVSKGVFMKVADLTYLLRTKDETCRPKFNDDFARLAAQLLPNQEFGADVEWKGFCNPKNEAYFAFPNSETGEVVYEAWHPETETENRKGCGESIYANKWPKGDDGKPAPRAQCKCGAWIRPYPNLARFKA